MIVPCSSRSSSSSSPSSRTSRSDATGWRPRGTPSPAPCAPSSTCSWQAPLPSWVPRSCRPVASRASTGRHRRRRAERGALGVVTAVLRAINPVDDAYGLGKSKVDDSEVGDH